MRNSKKRGNKLLGKVLNAIIDIPIQNITTRHIPIRHYSPVSRIIMPPSLIVPSQTVIPQPLISQTVLVQPNQNLMRIGNNGITINNRKGYTDSDNDDDCNINYNSFIGSNLNNGNNSFTSVGNYDLNNVYNSQNINKFIGIIHKLVITLI